MKPDQAWLDRLTRVQLAMTQLDLQQSVSAITKRGLTMLLILILSGVIEVLQGTGITLGTRITIADLLNLGVAVAAFAFLLSVYRQSVCVLSHGVRVGFRVPPDETACDGAVAMLAWSITLLVQVCLGYWILMRALMPVLAILTTRRWLLTTIDVCSLALALAAIIGVFAGLSPLLGRVGDSVARHVAPGPKADEGSDPVQAKCPKCGVLYESGSRFCSFCGHALSGTPHAE